MTKIPVKDLPKRKGINFNTSGRLLEIRLEGFDGLVGIVDEKEGFFYMPSLGPMQNRLKRFKADKFARVMGLYIGAGEILTKAGYSRRYIVDY